MVRRDVVGREVLVDKRSQVDAQARWRIDPIEGLAFRPVRPVPHEDGTVAEVARASWPEIDALDLPYDSPHAPEIVPYRW